MAVKTSSEYFAFDHRSIGPDLSTNIEPESSSIRFTCRGGGSDGIIEPVNLFVYGVVGRDYPKYVCCFGRDV